MTQHTHPLPSWADTPTRAAILAFVADVSTGPDALPPAERIAVFDNDGTLWTEKPMPVQLHFIIERWAAAVKENPDLADTQPYKAAVTGDFGWLAQVIDKHYAGDDTELKVLMGAVVASQAGQTVDAYGALVSEFVGRATHHTLGVPYAKAIYQPMLELLDHLRANEFSTYITSGGDRDFMRVFAEQLYGVEAEQVVGSSLGLSYVDDDDGGQVVYADSFSFFDDGPEKPVRIWSRIGRRPILAGGNSNGDVPMLRYASGSPRSLALLVHHDDPDRGDVPYDTGAETALATAATQGWTRISVRDDWTQVFPT